MLSNTKKNIRKLTRFKEFLVNESYQIEFDNRKILELTNDELATFMYSLKSSIDLSEISDRFSKIKNTNIYGKMRARYIKSWLLENNYYEHASRGLYTSIPTKKGNEIGIVFESIVINNQRKDRILFNLQAQKFIVEKYNDIYNFTISKKDLFQI